MKKTIKQHDIQDCGAACLASVAAHYKLGLSIAKIRQYAATDKRGTNVLGLLKAAERMYFNAKGVKGGTEAIQLIPLPAIAHVVVKHEQKELHHYVVIYKVFKRKIQVMDPAVGSMLTYDLEEFVNISSGVYVLLEPSEYFKATNAKTSTTRRFLELLLPHKKVILQALFGAIVYTILGLSTSIYIEKITDYVLVGGNIRLLNLMSVTMLLILSLQTFVGGVKSILILRTGQMMDAQLILGYYKHLLKLPQRFFDTMQIGEITSRISDAVKIRAFINDTAISIVVNTCIVIFAFALMFVYYWKLALIVLAVIPGYLIIYIAVNYWNKKRERRVMEAGAVLESQLVESLNGIKTMKQFDMETFANSKTEHRFVKLLYAVYASALNGVFTSTSSSFLSNLFTIITMWVGAYYVLENRITVGELMSFYALIGYFTSPVSQLIASSKTVQNALIATDRLYEIMDLEREESTTKFELEKKMIGDICFADVSFSYGTRVNVFKHFSIRFKKGTIQAIVGESGSGKSTLVSLLQNLYQIESGKIYVGAQNITYFSNKSLRRYIAAVPQEIQLFSGNVIQNIAVGITQYDFQKIILLCKELGILEFIEGLPNGFETQLGENGALLSGGQKQRIAIARALYKEPEILILDEASSSLDTISESYIKETLQKLKSQGKTILLIAHRLSSVKDADSIVVLGKGQVLEKGTHEGLLDLKAHYYKLWTSQTS